ncbi:MAG: glycosyltransferase [Selenomonadaceae bacterium]|nr:glycosyltransferase [Selenomonadaceae bacterium]
MNSAPKISVIVPMYNAERFLRFCVTSILEQTFKNFELILIDDCSTDKTLDIAKSFDDTRIKILQTEKNLGYPGAVRNVGLDAAIGEYVFFMDHDDVILPNAFEVLTDVADKNGADVVTTMSWYISSDFSDEDDMTVHKIDLRPPKPVSKDVKTRLWREIVEQGVHFAPWLYVYRRNFLADNKIKFPAEVAEDVFFTIDVIFATSKIFKITFPYYVWRKSESSASHDVSRAYKNMQSILNLNDYLEKKLAPLNDENFISKFIFAQIDGAINSYLAPFFKIDAETAMKALDEVTLAIKPRFGENTLFVRLLLHGYFQGRNAINENKKLWEELRLRHSD